LNYFFDAPLFGGATLLLANASDKAITVRGLDANKGFRGPEQTCYSLRFIH